MVVWPLVFFTTWWNILSDQYMLRYSIHIEIEHSALLVRISHISQVPVRHIFFFLTQIPMSICWHKYKCGCFYFWSSNYNVYFLEIFKKVTAFKNLPTSLQMWKQQHNNIKIARHHCVPEEYPLLRKREAIKAGETKVGRKSLMSWGSAEVPVSIRLRLSCDLRTEKTFSIGLRSGE